MVVSHKDLNKPLTGKPVRPDYRRFRPGIIPAGLSLNGPAGYHTLGWRRGFRLAPGRKLLVSQVQVANLRLRPDRNPINVAVRALPRPVIALRE